LALTLFSYYFASELLSDIIHAEEIKAGTQSFKKGTSIIFQLSFTSNLKQIAKRFDFNNLQENYNYVSKWFLFWIPLNMFEKMLLK
jgi:hypothetical protein